MTCFDCSEDMVMQHTLREGTRVYEWFECPNCRAQYLQLKPTERPADVPAAAADAEPWASRQAVPAPA